MSARFGWWAGWRIARYMPLRYVPGGLGWAANHTIPVFAGLALKAIFDRVSGGAPATWSALALVAVFVGVEVGRVLVWWWSMVFWALWWQGVSALLRVNVLSSLVLDREPAAGRVPSSSGEALNRFRDDVEDAVWFVDVWVDVAGGVLFTVIALVVMVRIDPVITLAVLLPMVAVVVGTRVLTAQITATHGASRRSGSSVSALLGELMGGVLALKVAGAERGAMNRLRAVNEERAVDTVRATLFAGLIEVCSVAAIEISIGLVLLLSAAEMRRGDFTVGDLALFNAYLAPLTGLPRWVGRMLARHRQALVALDRLGRMLPDRRPEGVVRHTPVYLRTPPPPLDRITALDGAAPFERLDVRALTVRAGAMSGVVGADVTVEAGSFTVITGAVGSGKTTLLRGLLGLIPAEEGTIAWNGERVDVPSAFFVPPRAAYAAQVPRLFSAELVENILLGWPGDEHDVREALRLAALDTDVDDMPDGLRTVVGARGVRLSGGQLQRATAARALVRRPELLVLDDLSSALDIETEQTLWERLAARPHATTLAVSHRRAALEQADQVVVLQQGRVVGAGSLDALLRSSTEMRRLWREELVVEAEEST